MSAASLISLNVILCEKVLQEKDNTYTAVRITDVFYFRRDPRISLTSQSIPMCILVLGKTEPEDTTEHSVQLILQRPDGNRTLMGEPLRAVFEARLAEEGQLMLAEGSKASDIIGGFSIRAEINVIPSQVGRHDVLVLLDDQVIAKAPFTILELTIRPLGA